MSKMERKARNAAKVGTKKSVLMTPDPYHTPGYGGFCPQFKYRIGQTFGRTTSRLLTDDEVASSGKLVLGCIDPSQNSDQADCQSRSTIIQTRTASFGDQKLVEKMVPGYTGFIPKSQHFFGKRYARNCKSAISDFELDQKGHSTKMRELTKPPVAQEGVTLPPLKPTAQAAKPYIPKNVPQHTMSPFCMDSSNPEKMFVSGYTGFVPRARGLLGAGYPFITHLAMADFADSITRQEQLSTTPVQIVRQEQPMKITKPIYPVEMGLVPHYTGHIPGQKSRYGDTFGHSTMNALAKLNRSQTKAPVA